MVRVTTDAPSTEALATCTSHAATARSDSTLSEMSTAVIGNFGQRAGARRASVQPAKGGTIRDLSQIVVRPDAAVGARAAPAAANRPELTRSSSSEESMQVSNLARREVHRIKMMGILCFLPSLLTVWYSAAIFFPPDARKSASALLWTPGVLHYTNDTGTGVAVVCPKATLCSEGWGEILLLMLSRFTAFAMYVSMFLTFLSKCHATMHFLSATYVAYLYPMEYLHTAHKSNGFAFCAFAALHTLGHLIRWGMRNEMHLLVQTAPGLSGLVAMLLMLLVVVPMATPAIKKRVSFEFRFNLHWLLLPMAFALCWHSPRVLILTLIAVGLWALDYTYVLVFRTFRLDVVELTRLPDGGVQMLFHNPTGFEPHAGEFIKVKFPWLEQGGDEWHPFSFYMREATAEGLSAARPSIAGKLSLPMGAGKSGRSRVSVQGEDAQFSRAMSELSMGDSSTLMSQEVRNDEPEYTTTQCFIMPAGDWTKSLSEAVKNRGGAARNRSCWVRGPYPSPFAIAADFSQLVLFASGIGITPALAVMGQYRGNDRMKFMVWATRSPHMLKFFAPLLSDAQVATVYYTGKEKLTPAQINQIRSSCDGNLFIHQKRPEWDKVLGKHILTFENSAAQGSHKQLCDRVEDLPPQVRGSWCGLYCGGSTMIRDKLAASAKQYGIGWQVELFDW